MIGFDELWRGGPRFMQGADCFRLSTDSVLLADFAKIKKVRRCLDLGSGAGVLCVLLAAFCDGLSVVGIEISPEAAELSRLNLRENGMEQRAEIITGDLREHAKQVAAESFDLVVSNPPYFAKKTGYSAPEEARATAREERECSLEDVCAAARWSLRWGGSFALVHRPERLSELLCAMTRAGIEPKRLRMVCHSAEKAPSLVLVEGRRGGNSGLTIEPALVLTDENGGDSPEVRKIYRRGEFTPPLEELEI